jgi:beta-lactamase class A
MNVRKWVAILVIALLGMLGLLTVPTGAKAATSSETNLQTKLTSFFATQKGNYTLALRELDSPNHEVDIDANRRIEPASVIKLFYAWAALQEVDAGHVVLSNQLQPGFTWDTCMSLMIKVSDNDCASWVREAIGNAAFNLKLAEAGYENTRVVLDSLTGKYKTKYTTAADTALLLKRLQTGTALSSTSTTYFKNLLRAQVFRSRITAGVQAGTTVLNKGGELWVSSGWTESDAAIVLGPETNYVLVVFGRNNAMNASIAQASTIVYEHLQGSTVTTPSSFPPRQYLTNLKVWVRSKPAGKKLYQVPLRTAIVLYYADRDWVKIKPYGKPAGYLKFSALNLRSQYVWP